MTAETRPDLMARQIVDLAIPAAVAAPDKLSMVLSPRFTSCHGKVAVNGLRIGFLTSSASNETSRHGANLSAMAVSEATCGRLGMANPPRRVVCQTQRCQQPLKSSLTKREMSAGTKSGHCQQPRRGPLSAKSGLDTPSRGVRRLTCWRRVRGSDRAADTSPQTS